MYEADPMTRAQIVAIADAVREVTGISDPFFPVVDFVEHFLFEQSDIVFEVQDERHMGTRHGYWDPFDGVIAIRSDVYEGAVKDLGRDRFTMMHEVGHALLHPTKLNRLSANRKRLEAFRDPEWQANTFAAAILMPPDQVTNCSDVDEVVREFGVTRSAAKCWITKSKIELGHLHKSNRWPSNNGGHLST